MTWLVIFTGIVRWLVVSSEGRGTKYRGVDAAAPRARYNEPRSGTQNLSSDETPSHSTRLSKNDNQVAGYRLVNNTSQVIGYAHGLLVKLLAI
jgi:hypothetical protein